MEDIETRQRVEEARKQALGDAIIRRIKEVQKLLGEDPAERCRQCHKHPFIGHTEDCPLRRITPEIIRSSQLEAAKHLKKHANKQRIFKSTEPKRKWIGGPPMQKSLVRRRRTPKPKGALGELQQCDVCIVQRLFVKGVCSTCYHKHRCPENPGGRECKVCH